MAKLPQNRRLVVAHNPHSSKAAAVQGQVFDRLNAAGYEYETIEVQQAHLNDNVARLSPLIQPNDIILSAAGDGSAHAVFHAVVAANQPGVELGFLAFGNFNDIPHVFNSKETQHDPVAFLEQAKPEVVWPLQISVDGAPLRSALLYATAGWTAKAASQFDDPKIRSSLKRGGAGLVRSLWRLGLYYLKTRRGSALPPFRYGGKMYTKTDLICANSPTVARLFRSGKPYHKRDVFLFRMLDVRRLIPNIPFLVLGILGRMRGEETAQAAIEFAQPSQVSLQCDGEVVELQDVSRLEIKKSCQSTAILMSK